MEEGPADPLDFFADLDVVHVMFWYEKRGAICKIVDNLTANARRVRQKVVSFPDFPLDLASVLNEIQPRIIHLHYVGEHPESEFLKRLTYRPHIVHTVHNSGPSIFSDIADKVVCISQFGLNNNPGGLWIENSVDVSGIPRHEPNRNGICSALRFSADQMQPALLDLFSGLNATTCLYGADDFMSFDPAHNKAICEYAGGFDNIECRAFCRDLERSMTEHSFFAYYTCNNNPFRCYGLTLMEAVSLGIPVVALRRDQSGQKYVVHGYNGFIANSDREFSGYCERILESDELYLELCTNASRHADRIENSMPRRYEELYLSLL